MKKLLFIVAFVMGLAMAQGQTMKMVVDTRGNVVGRYGGVSGNNYIIEVQDTGYVPKRGHKVVTFSATRGQGVVYYAYGHTGNLNVRKQPTTRSTVVAQIIDPQPEGNVPDCFDCLGKVNGWYKVRVNGKVGYVRSDLLNWDGMCTF